MISKNSLMLCSSSATNIFSFNILPSHISTLNSSQAYRKLEPENHVMLNPADGGTSHFVLNLLGNRYRQQIVDVMFQRTCLDNCPEVPPWAGFRALSLVLDPEATHE